MARSRASRSAQGAGNLSPLLTILFVSWQGNNYAPPPARPDAHLTTPSSASGDELSAVLRADLQSSGE